MNITQRALVDDDEDSRPDNLDPGFNPTTTAGPATTMSFAKKSTLKDVLEQCLSSMPGVSGPRS